MEEMKLKEAMLSQLLSKYNEKLANVGKKYGFLGKYALTKIIKIFRFVQGPYEGNEKL